MKSKVLVVVALGVSWLVSCSHSPSLPPGVTLRVKNGEVYLALDKDVAVNVYQNKTEDRRFVIVANHGDSLRVLQVEKGGDTPRDLELFSAAKASFTVDSGATREPRTIIMDQDGDGVPDLKIEGSKKYKPQIEWILLPRPQPSPAS